MNQFYNLIRSFLILTTLLIVKQGVAQNVLYFENFPNTWNTANISGAGTDVFNGNLGTWNASANSDRIIGTINTPGGGDAYSLQFIGSVNNLGGNANFEVSSPVNGLDLSGQAGNPNVMVNFLVNTDGLDATDACSNYTVQYFNSVNGFQTVWAQTPAGLVTAYGNTGWHQVTLAVPLTYLTSDFQIFIDNNIPNTCGTANQTLLLDNLVISNGGFDILPVNIITFTGSYNNGSANLNWTVDESGIRSYTVERSADGRNFQSLSKLAALNSGSRTTYTYSDNLKEFSGGNVYYRLNILENTGYQHYSKIISLKTALINGVSLSPNPARSYTNLSFNAVVNQTALIEVFDANGRARLNQRVSLFKGGNTVQLNKLEQLPAGVYMIRTTVDGKLISTKVVVD
jgi:hypothetical protein